MTATAPASWAAFALRAKPQVPRTMSATLPASSAPLVTWPVVAMAQALAGTVATRSAVTGVAGNLPKAAGTASLGPDTAAGALTFRKNGLSPTAEAATLMTAGDEPGEPV